MTDVATVPDKANGMGCFALNNVRLALVRYLGLVSTDDSGGVLGLGFGVSDGVLSPAARPMCF